MFHLIIFIGVWTGFAVFGFTQKWSATISIGGGFFVTCAGLAILVTVFDSPNTETESSTIEIVQQQPSIKQAAPKTANKRDLLVGEWLCRNDSNYIHKTVFKSDGSYLAYDSGYVPGVVSDTPLSHTGTFKLDGDILRIRSKSLSGYESESTTLVNKLTNDELVKYYQNMNFYESCYKPIE